MRILRIDPQGCLDDTVFKNKEQMRLALCDYHSIDWQEGMEKTDPDYFSRSLFLFESSNDCESDHQRSYGNSWVIQRQ